MLTEEFIKRVARGEDPKEVAHQFLEGEVLDKVKEKVKEYGSKALRYIGRGAKRISSFAHRSSDSLGRSLKQDRVQKVIGTSNAG